MDDSKQVRIGDVVTVTYENCYNTMTLTHIVKPIANTFPKTTVQGENAGGCNNRAIVSTQFNYTLWEGGRDAVYYNSIAAKNLINTHFIEGTSTTYTTSQIRLFRFYDIVDDNTHRYRTLTNNSPFHAKYSVSPSYSGPKCEFYKSPEFNRSDIPSPLEKIAIGYTESRSILDAPDKGGNFLL